MKFSNLDTIDLRHEALQQILAVIQRDGYFPRSFKHARYWKPDVLTFDFQCADGVGFGFDLECNTRGYKLRAVPRGDASLYRLRGRLGAETKAVAGQTKRELTWWHKTHSLQGIALGASARMCAAISLLETSSKSRNSRSVGSYWWDHQANFGDAIGPWLIELITGRPAHNVIDASPEQHGIMTVGSIITDMNRPNMTIWGSGLLGPLRPHVVARLEKRPPRLITAVRGALTRNELVTELGWNVPEIFGDPALLLPRFVTPSPPLHRAATPAIVPHYSHKSLVSASVQSGEDEHFSIVDVGEPVEKVVAQIANSKSVVSTSLHGLILAQAYGVPWTWLRLVDKALVGDEFKFRDFFSTLDDRNISICFVDSTDLNTDLYVDLAKDATLPDARYDPSALLDAFPHRAIPRIDVDYLKR